MSRYAQYIVRHEVYIKSGTVGRILTQEWEEERWLPDFFKAGYEDYHEGNPLHVVRIEEKLTRQMPY